MPGAPLARGPGQQLRVDLAIGVNLCPQCVHLVPRDIERPAPTLFLPIEVDEGPVFLAAGTTTGGFTAGDVLLFPHDLRRTAVRNLMRTGVPDLVAMSLTGHKTRSVFGRYDITSPSDLRAAARRLDAGSSGRQWTRRAAKRS